MSAVAIGLLFLACGWKLYKDAIYTRYLALKNTGHPQYFGGALCAVLVFWVSYSIDSLLMRHAMYLDLVVLLFGHIPIFADARQEKFVREFARVFIWAIPSTFLLVRALNYPFHKSPALVLAAARKTRIVDELEEVIYYALSARPMLSILITTKSKKVYIGIPKRHSADPDRDRVWLAMWTLASGFRNEKGELDITTLYGDVMSGQSLRSHNDFQIVIPLAEIASAQAFDLRQYAQYLSKKFHRAPPAASTAPLASVQSGSDDERKREMLAKISHGSHHQFMVATITQSILPWRDRYILRMNSYYVVLLVGVIIFLPYVKPFIALSMLVASLFAALESIQPMQVRFKIWREHARNTSRSYSGTSRRASAPAPAPASAPSPTAAPLTASAPMEAPPSVPD